MCMRRANDISQDGSFSPSPTVGRHDNPRFGTHHARDAHGVFATLGHDLPLWSSAIVLNTQYMHVLHFSLTLDHDITVEEAVARLAANARWPSPASAPPTRCSRSGGTTATSGGS